MCVFGEEDEFNEYGEKINEKNEEDNQTPMFDDKLSEYQSYVDGNIIDADDDIKEYMKWFNSIPLYKRSSSDIIYPDDMTTMLTGGRIDAVKPEEYEQYMTTSLAPYIKVYHMTTEQQIYQKIKGGEWGQLIFSIAASPFDKNVILLGNDTSGIYRSDDGGKTWNLSCDGLMGLSVCTIAFDPDIEGVVYACMGGSTNKARFGYLGIYKSEDNGRNWRHVLSLDNTKRVGKLIAFGKLDSSGHRPIFAACDDITGYDSNGTGYKGIFRSYDRGESWENIGFTDKNVLNIQTTPDTDLIIANVEKGGLQISTDNGNTWFDISGTIPLEKKEEQINDEKASNTGYVVSGLNMDKNEIAAAAIESV
ncbi:MAG: glycoside hydrolase [Clostridiales bacterium]|nr:MAG: glycoside hydrolase [Clostridiales bacterium]